MDTRTTIGSRAAIIAALLATFLAVALWHSSPAKAADFDVGNGDVAGLKAAINAANQNNEADTISLADNGTYTLTEVDNTAEGSNGLPQIASEITIEGNGATIQRSDADGTPAFRILRVSDDGNLTLESTTISGGDGNGGGGNGGGGALNRGTLTASNSTFSQNIGGLGGGIFNVFGTLDISNSTFPENLTGNRANRQGGGIYNLAGDLDISGSTFSKNSADLDGGAIYHSSSDGSVTVSNSTFSENTAGRNGGGIFHRRGALTVSDSTFSKNTANGKFDFEGGGIYTANEEFTEDPEDPEDRTTITNSTFTENKATGTDGAAGGAIQNIQGLTEINFSTITGNTASEGNGGGIASGGYDSSVVTRISSSIVTGNSSDVDNFDGDSPYESGGFNLIGDGERASDFDEDSDRTGVTVEEAFGTDSPTLADNGGPTETIALEEGAGATNAANPNDFPATDQRGIKRPQSAASDIGAFEIEVPATDTNLTLDSGSNVITFPQNVGLGGRLVGEGGQAVPNAEIIIERRFATQRAFQRIGATTTNQNGAFTARVSSPRNTVFRARFAGDGGSNPSIAATRVNVRAAVNLRLSRNAVRPGQNVIVSGNVRPVKRSFAVLTIRRGGQIVVNRRINLNNRGAYRFVYRVPTRGNYSATVRFNGDADNVANASSRTFRAR
ncbi:MAG: hypothetical protein H0V75_14380 [Rubrobacter sp.]|nr:hypothetical protein [Rubrobacter sp.]